MSDSVVLVRGFFEPGKDAVSRSMMELMSEMNAAGTDCSIYCYTTPADLGALDEWGRQSIRCAAPKFRHGRYTLVDRVAFIVLSLGMIVARRRKLRSVVTMDDPTGLGLLHAMICKFSGISLEHIVYLMDLQSVQYVSLAQGHGIRSLLLKSRARLDKLTWSWADRLVVLGSCMQDLVGAAAPQASVSVVPIWQDSRRIYQQDSSEVRTALGLDGQFVVMYHGHASFRAPMTALTAAARSLQADESIQFVVVGHGPSVDALQQEVLDQGLINVTVLPKVDGSSLLETLSLGDVHLAILDERATGTCVPSKTYTAMAVGRPCIYLGDCEGQAAIDLVAADAGFVLGTEDGAGLATVIQRLATEEGLSTSLGSNGHEFFLQQRDLTNAVESWQHLLS